MSNEAETPEPVRVRLNWDGADTTPVNPATLCVVQANAPDVVLTFGYFVPPVALGLKEHTPEEMRELADGRTMAPSQITRVSLPAEQALAMAQRIVGSLQSDGEEEEEP